MKTTAFICASTMTMGAGLIACCLSGCARSHSGEVVYQPIPSAQRASGNQFTGASTNPPLSYQWYSTNNGPLYWELYINTNSP